MEMWWDSALGSRSSCLSTDRITACPTLIIPSHKYSYHWIPKEGSFWGHAVWLLWLKKIATLISLAGLFGILRSLQNRFPSSLQFYRRLRNHLPPVWKYILSLLYGASWGFWLSRYEMTLHDCVFSKSNNKHIARETERNEYCQVAIRVCRWYYDQVEMGGISIYIERHVCWFWFIPDRDRGGGGTFLFGLIF